MLLGHYRRSTDECRPILTNIQENLRMSAGPSSYIAWASYLRVKQALGKVCDDDPIQNTAQEEQCKVFIWKPRKAYEATEHITTYESDATRSKSSVRLGSDALSASVYSQEEPYTEHPFHGLVNEAKVSTGLYHRGDICLSIRSPAVDSLEQALEETTMREWTNISHFAVLLDGSDASKGLALATLEPAADALGCWLEESMLDAGLTASSQEVWESVERVI